VDWKEKLLIAINIVIWIIIIFLQYSFDKKIAAVHQNIYEFRVEGDRFIRHMDSTYFELDRYMDSLSFELKRSLYCQKQKIEEM
jgi:hypothetical protein